MRHAREAPHGSRVQRPGFGPSFFWFLTALALGIGLQRKVKHHELRLRNRAGQDVPIEILNESRYRALIEHSSDIISLLDAHGTILYKSPPITKILGWDSDDLIGHNAMEVAHPDDRPMLQALFLAVLQHPDHVFKGEFRHLHKNGTYRWMEGVSTNLLGEPSIRAIVFNYRDISARKEAEEALEAAQFQLQQYTEELELRVAERTERLQESLRSLEGVLYHVAHDLRAPLRALDGYIALLKEQDPVSHDPIAFEYGTRISEAAKHMDDLIRDLLEYGRLGHVELPLEMVNLEVEFKAILRRLSHELNQTQARVSIAPGLAPVRAHPHTLHQVLFNLIENAIKFVKVGEKPVVRIWTEPRGAKVRVFIEDEGIGIAPEYQEKVFRVFERLQPASAYPGTGIGLAIVRKGLERMAETIGVISALGKGSCFWLELPAATVASPKTAELEEAIS